MAIDTSSSINGVMTSAQYNAQKAATPQNTNMGQTEFLTLFTTQLKNQNPLDPVKNEAFVAQLAQFSQLEATTAMKGSMQNLVSSLANDRLLVATSLIGKTVGVPDGPVAVTDTTVSQGVVNAPTGADGVKVEIFNDKGILVRTQIMGPQTAGDITIAWDGMNDGGTAVPNGNYRYVASVNSNGTVTKPTVNTYAQVMGVSSAGTADGTMLLEVAGGKTVNLADVKRISY
jgi:flagellar basal-body rod modification protein FlgD